MAPDGMSIGDSRHPNPCAPIGFGPVPINRTETTMNRLAAMTLVCSSLLWAIPIARSHGANLLTNGSFETWSGGRESAIQPDRIFNDGSLAVTGWNFAIGLSSDLYRD